MSSLQEVLASLGSAISSILQPGAFFTPTRNSATFAVDANFKQYILDHPDFGYYYGFGRQWAFASVPDAIFPPILSGTAPRPSPFNSGPTPSIFDAEACPDPDFQRYKVAHRRITEEGQSPWPLSGLLGMAALAVVVGGVVANVL